MSIPRRSVIALLGGAAILIASAVFASGAMASPGDPFTGAWTAIDTDGSTLNLSIGGANPAGVRKVFMVDLSATACGGGSATVNGFETQSGNTLDGTVLVRCNGTGVTFSADFPLVASGGQIFANGVVFSRHGS
jgi:hypothetical protein